MPRLTLSEQVQSLTSQLASAQSQINSLELDNKSLQAQVLMWADRANKSAIEAGDNEKLKKELETQRSSSNYNRELSNRYKDEIDQAHAVLDGVEGSPSRKLEGDYSGERSLVTRLAVTFLAIVKMGRA